MGSNSREDLPAADAASVALVLATADERRRVWTLSHAMWGQALSVDDYVDREAYLTTVPLAMDDGVTHWILTDTALPPGQRPILSSCETLRKAALAAGTALAEGGSSGSSQEVTVVDGVAHGIASVFTDPQYRGHGYAGRMLRELGQRLRHWQAASPAHKDGGGPTTLFSVLYSDIGKSYYASKGWAPFPSTHLSFAPRPEPPAGGGGSSDSGSGSGSGFAVEPLGYHELTELCPLDVQLLRARLARRAARRAAAAAASGSDKAAAGPSVALAPDLNTMLWHLMREDYMTKHIFRKTPSVRGALCRVGGGRSMWLVWTRSYYGGAETTEGNTLYVLRAVLEDVDDDEPDAPGEQPITPAHVAGFAAMLRLAQAEAAAWHCGSVQLWNPTPALRILADRSGIAYTEVDREKDSIASLMWHGAGATERVDWVANEKYGWY